MRNEVVEDDVDASDLEPGFLGVSGPANQVKHGILVGTRAVTGRRVDDQRPGAVQRFRFVVAMGQVTMRDVLDRDERRRVGGNVHQARLEAFVGENVLVGRIGDAQPVDDKVVGIEVGLDRSDRESPQAGLILLHRLAGREELPAEFDLLRIRGAEVEGHRAVGVHDGGV